jgi:hypothetical protein
VNETHATLFTPEDDDDGGRVVRDFRRDNDDGELCRPPSPAEIERVNDAHYEFFRALAHEHYAHWSPTFQGPLGDPYEALAWRRPAEADAAADGDAADGGGAAPAAAAEETTQQSQSTTQASQTPAPDGRVVPPPLLTVRAVVSNYTAAALPLLEAAETLFDAIRRGLGDDPRVRYELYVLQREDHDARRFYAQPPDAQQRELDAERDAVAAMHRAMRTTFDVSERHLARRLPLEDVLHVWSEGANVHHLVDGFAMVKLWGRFRADVLLAPKNVAAVVAQVAYALYGEADAAAVLTKRLSTLRSGQEPEAFDRRFAMGANLQQLPGEAWAVVGGRESFWRAKDEIDAGRRYAPPPPTPP